MPNYNTIQNDLQYCSTFKFCATYGFSCDLTRKKGSCDFIHTIKNEDLYNLIFPRQRHGAFRRVWWAQDGAHLTELLLRQCLTGHFGNRVISVHNEVEWPPCSLDLTPCDFFSLGDLQNKIFTTPPANIHELCPKIDPGMIR